MEQNTPADVPPPQAMTSLQSLQARILASKGARISDGGKKAAAAPKKSSTKVAAAEGKNKEKIAAAEPTKWNPELEKMLVQIFSDEVASLGGGAPDNGSLKSTSWTKVHQRFAVESGKNWPKSVLQSRMAGFKSAYMAVSSIRELSGFGWDAEKNIATAPADVWEKLLEAHPKWAEWKTKSLELYDQLCAIYTGTVATGEYSSGGADEESDAGASVAGAEDEDEADDAEDENEEGDNNAAAAAGGAAARETPAKRRDGRGTPASASALDKQKESGKKGRGGAVLGRKGEPPAKKNKNGSKAVTSIDKIVESVASLAEAIKSGSNAELNGRVAAIKTFNNTRIAKAATITQKLRFKAHLLKDDNYILFSTFDLGTAAGVEEVEEYITGIIGAVVAVDAEEEEA